MAEYVVAKYLRLSSEDVDLKQAGKQESNSIVNQRNLLDSFLSRMPDLAGAKILEFCDDGWSGKNFERPAVKEMLEMVRGGKIRCIVVKDLSRFGRDYLTVGNYISRVFPFMGVRFIAVNDGFDSNRPMDIDSLETSFKTLLYDLYSRDLSRKVRNAKLFRAKRGDFMSPFAPYGYIKDPCNKNHLLIDPEAAAVVRRIFHMAAGGCSTDDIAKTLNQEKIPTPMRYKQAAGCSRERWPSIQEENFWTHKTIDRITNDERYIGNNVYGKMRREAAKTEWTVTEQTHESIVTNEEFDLAQAALHSRPQRVVTYHDRPLARKVRCGVCGYTMTRSKAKKPYYHCRTLRVINTFSCPDEKIYEQDILDAVLNELRVQAKIAVEAEIILAERRNKIKRDADLVLRDLKKMRAAYEMQDRYVKGLYDSLVFGDITKEQYLEQKNTAVKERDAIAAKIRSLELEMASNDASNQTDNAFIASFRAYEDLDELTAEIANDLLREVRVFPGNRLEIVWNHAEAYEQLLRTLEDV